MRREGLNVHGIYAGTYRYTECIWRAGLRDVGLSMKTSEPVERGQKVYIRRSVKVLDTILPIPYGL
jgi:hypothetical protein